MKIILPCGTGQVGTILARALLADGHEVVVFFRSAHPSLARVVRWDGETVGDWARELEGADVVINYNRTPEGAQEALKGVESAGRKGLIVQANLSKTSDVRTLVNKAIEHFGRLDILVNNAGIEVNAPFWEVTEEDYDKVVDLNLKAVFFGTQAMVQHLMKTKRRGKIINISSVHEDLAFPNFAAYCCAKGGVRMLTRNLAVELGPLGININSIAPGAIETPINSALLNNPKKLNSLLHRIPLGYIAKPKDVAGVAVFLASEEANYVTGSTYFVDAGVSLFYEEQ